MELKIKIRMDNAAFNYGPEREAARILKCLAWRLENLDTSDTMILMDQNGNKVGSAKLC